VLSVPLVPGTNRYLGTRYQSGSTFGNGTQHFGVNVEVENLSEVSAIKNAAEDYYAKLRSSYSEYLEKERYTDKKRAIGDKIKVFVFWLFLLTVSQILPLSIHSVLSPYLQTFRIFGIGINPLILINVVLLGVLGITRFLNEEFLVYAGIGRRKSELKLSRLQLAFMGLFSVLKNIEMYSETSDSERVRECQEHLDIFSESLPFEMLYSNDFLSPKSTVTMEVLFSDSDANLIPWLRLTDFQMESVNAVRGFYQNIRKRLANCDSITLVKNALERLALAYYAYIKLPNQSEQLFDEFRRINSNLPKSERRSSRKTILDKLRENGPIYFFISYIIWAIVIAILMSLPLMLFGISRKQMIIPILIAAVMLAYNDANKDVNVKTDEKTKLTN